jgi:hypothetical protein
MGFFSFVGKALGGVAKAALGIGAKVLPGPLGSVAKVAHSILSVKHGATPKMAPSGGFTPGIQTGRSRAGAPAGLPAILRGHRPNVRPVSMSGGWGPQALRSSPVLPGGAIATPSGPTPPTAAPPPMSFGGRSASAGPSRRRRKSTKSSTRRAGSRKKSGGRKLKFGSPAWRKKYMKRRRRAA